MIQTFLSLMRVRTLPLAVAVILCGNALAYYNQHWHCGIFILSLLTALSLQIVSNVANDYGDGIRGTDNHRSNISPTRITATGKIPPQHIRRYVYLSVMISLVLGITLLFVSIHSISQLILFILLGILSILAALTYTIGRTPYGYLGLGEVSVFLFFGLVGVLGSYSLHQAPWQLDLILPASGIGLLSAAVLNVNNIRDIETDQQAGKYTLAVRLGFQSAKIFQIYLIISAIICLTTFAATLWQSGLWAVLLPSLYRHGQRILEAQNLEVAGNELRTMVFLTLSISILFSLGILIAA